MNASGDGRLRVSVIIAVFNTGEHIEPLIRSLAKQTMPAEDFECIFVDDGSTDEVTPARLDRLAAEQPNVIVRHEPNSGWPGRPRNVGIDTARGKYVFFADHDDWFGVEALQRMADMADTERADILVPRYAGHRRGVARDLFERPRPAASLENAPFMDSLTPHKLFRRDFLSEHNLRFPEGRRRLEDHVFVTEAYFLAQRMSVLTDYHCYFHIGRHDGGNAAYQRIVPAGYYGNLREVLDVIWRYSSPGAVRNSHLRRALRMEVLARLSPQSFLEQDEEYRRELFTEARRVAVDLIPPDVDEGLPPPQRAFAYLLRADRFDEAAGYAEWQNRLGGRAVLTKLTSKLDKRLVIEATARLVDSASGKPWTYHLDGTSVRLAAPPAIVADVPAGVLDCTSGLATGRAEVVFRRRADSQQWVLPTKSTVQTHDTDTAPWVSHHVRSYFDPRTAAAGGPVVPGTWDLFIRVRQTGWNKEFRLAGDPETLARVRPQGAGAWLVTAYLTDKGNVSFKIERRTTARRRLRRTAGRIVRRLQQALRRPRAGRRS